MALSKSRCGRSALLSRVCASAMMTAGVVTTAYAQSPEKTVDFDLPAQSLEQALKSFGVSANRQLMFATDLAEGKMVAGLSGEMEPMQALDELLAGTGLVYETTPSNVILVKAGQEEIAADSGSLRSTSSRMLTAQTPTSGGESRRRTSSQNEGSLSTDEEVERLEEIIVTGTNIRGVQNPTTPVLQFDREDIDLSGASTVEDFLRVIPQNFSGFSPVATISSSDFGPSSAFSETSVDLRGLGAGSTLTLLNGRRMTATGGGSSVDISLLPLGAIERVDLLTDGASAVYGSDAVGGVVNFITRKDFEGLEVNARYGTVTDGSREEYVVGGAGGRSWRNGNAMLGIDYVEQKPLLARERDYIDLDIANPDATLGSRSERLSATVSLVQDVTSKLEFAADGLYSNREASFTQNDAGQLAFDSEQDALFINTRLNYDLGEDWSAALYYDYSREDVTATSSASSGTSIENSLHSGELQLSGSLLSLPSGKPVSFAFGGGFRRERFELTALFDRDVYSAYGELLVPLVSEENAVPFVESLSVSIAGRYEDFSDFGDTFNPKLGLSWSPISDLLLRATFSQSFRAPTLQERFDAPSVLIFSYPTSVFTAVEPPPPSDSAPDGAVVALVNFGGNQSLSEETADVWSGGFEFTPEGVPGLRVSATYFTVSYSDRIETIGTLEPYQNPGLVELLDFDPDPSLLFSLVEQALAAQAEGGFGVINPFGFALEDVQLISNTGLRNIAVREVDGFDFTLEYGLDTEVGAISTSINVAYLLNYDGQLSQTSLRAEEVDTLYRPLQLKLRGSVSWTKDGLSVSAAINHAGKYDSNVDRSIARSIGTWTTMDLNFSYDASDRFDSAVFDGTRLSVNVRNAFDEDPPFVATPDGFNFDSLNADPFGRFVSLAISRSF